MELATVIVAPGAYDIGHPSIPNASPQHRRQLAATVWLDQRPVTWRHFELFIAAGGYLRADLWPEGCDHTHIRTVSLDRRHRELLEQASDFRSTLPGWPQEMHPVTGLNWFEAYAVARFYGARLPFEVEWEVALGEAGPIPPAYRTLGLMHEWTQDTFAPVYYRADFARRGVPWNPKSTGATVSLRGSTPADLYQHVSARSGRDPNESDGFCGFRRAWDMQPTPEQIICPWP